MMDDSLPPGWTRKVTQRATGKSAGKYDVYIYSPDGKKFRSRRDLENYFLKMNIDWNINDFNFSVRGEGSLVSKSPAKSNTSAKKASTSETSKTSASKTKKFSSKDKKGKSITQNLVVKMHFPSPLKRRNAKKMTKSSKMRRSNSVGAVLLRDTKIGSRRKSAGETKASTLQRSLSLELGSTGRSPRNRTQREAVLVMRSCKLSPKETSAREKNNNDVGWKASPPMGHKLGKRKGSQSSPIAEHTPEESPSKVRRKMSANTPDEMPKTRRLSVQEPNQPAKGEEIVLSKIKT